MKRELIYDLINAERDFQDRKFPNDVENWDKITPHVKYVVLGEEFGEIGEAILKQDYENLIEELVQVAAVCVKWLEHVESDRGYDDYGCK